MEVAVGHTGPVAGTDLVAAHRIDLDLDLEEDIAAGHTDPDPVLEEGIGLGERRTGPEEAHRRTGLGVAVVRSPAEEDHHIGHLAERRSRLALGWSSRPLSRNCGR